MQHAANLLRGFSPTVADAPDGSDEWAKSPVSTMSDAQLISAVAAAISRPKAEAESSFLLHAPLELAARAALLSMIDPSARDHARRRIAAIAARYASEGVEIEDQPRRINDEESALRDMCGAIRDVDADAMDAALLFLIPRVSGAEIRRALAAEIMPMLGAAAHAPILLAELPRLDARIENAAALLRAPLRDLVKYASLRLSWHERCVAPRPVIDHGEALFETLLAPPRVHSDSVYIAPTMLAVEAKSYANRLLADVTAGVSVNDARRAILRVGAMSMLQDDPESAPYGWSHAITMPQGVFGCADAVEDKRLPIRVAATYALGFRATMGKVRLIDAPPPKPRSGEVVGVAPIEAAGAVFHAPQVKMGEIRTFLATRAATHEDAHLAKYTLASFDAASGDPEATRLFLAAAAYLGAWWDQHPGLSFE